MYGMVNELRSTQHSSVTLAFTNDVDKHSGDYKSLYGFVNYVRHRGSGRAYGIQNIVYSDGTGEKRGLYNNVQDNSSDNAGSTSDMFAVYNYLYSTYRPRSYANYNILVNNNSDVNDEIYGLYVEETGSGSAKTYGVYSVVDNRPNDYAGYFLGKVYINDTYSGSDKKLKKDIKGIASALAIIDSLQPTSYHFNELAGKSFDQERLHYGFIAQDLERVLPDLVTEVVSPARYKYDDEYLVNGDTTAVPKEAEVSVPASTHKAIRYNDLIAILAQAIKEEHALVKEHEKKIKEEKGKNDKFKEDMNVLRTLVNELSTRLSYLESCTDCGNPSSQTPTTSPQSLKESDLTTGQLSLKEAGFSIFPNPTTDRLTVEGPGMEGKRLYLYDSQGRRVLDLPYVNGSTELHIGSLPSGSYHLDLFDEITKKSVGKETVILR